MQVVCNKIPIMLSVMCFLSGCSWHYLDDAGNERIVGFSAVTLTKKACTLLTTVKTAGIALDTTRDSGGLNVGYRSVSSIYLKKDESGSLENSSLRLLLTSDASGNNFTERSCQH